VSCRRTTAAILILVVVLGWFLRTIPLSYSHFWDETVYLQDAEVLGEGRTNYDELNYRPPLLSVLYAAGFRVWDNIYAANFVQGAVTALAIPFVFLFTATYFSERAGLFAAGLFAFCPYLAGISHELMSDAPAVSLMIASLYFFSRSSPLSFFVSGLLFAGASLTRFSSVFLAVYFALWVASSPSKLKGPVPFAGGALAGFIPYWIWVQIRYGFFLSTFMEASRDVSVWDPYNPPALFFRAIPKIFPAVVLLSAAVAAALVAAELIGRKGAAGHRVALKASAGQRLVHRLALLAWGIALMGCAATMIFEPVRFLRPLALAALILVSVIAIAALTGVFDRRPAAQGDGAEAAAGGESLRQQLILLLWGVLYFVYMLTLRHKEMRYLLPLVVPVLILSAVGLDEIFGFLGRRLAVLKLAGGAALALALAATIAPSFAKIDKPWVDDNVWHAVSVADYLSRVSQKNDRIYTAFQFPVLAFYTGLDTVPLSWDAYEFPRHWRACMKYPGFYVYFADEPRDWPRLGSRFLETHREFTPLKNFGFARVYRYVPDRLPVGVRAPRYASGAGLTARTALLKRSRQAGRLADRRRVPSLSGFGPRPGVPPRPRPARRTG
jgi:Dolichyl-phosphate-mannose-protein mannosyltransferase